MPLINASECNFADIHFMPPSVDSKGKTSVDVYWSADSIAKSNRLKFTAANEKMPMRALFALDSVREDAATPLRRTQKVLVEDPEVLAQLQTLDETIIEAAVKNAVQWFKKPLDRATLVSRYNPVISQDGDKHVFKFKVKCPGHEVATKMHLCPDFTTPPLSIHLNRCDIADLKPNALIIPNVSTLGLYFIPGPMGMWGMTFNCDELILNKACAPPPLANFKMSTPFNIVEDMGDGTKDVSSLKRSFEELQEEISKNGDDVTLEEESPSKKGRHED